MRARTQNKLNSAPSWSKISDNNDYYFGVMLVNVLNRHLFIFNLYGALFSLRVLGEASPATPCDALLLGQYLCSAPEIDPGTQQPIGCDRNNIAAVMCEVAEGVECDSLSENRTFIRTVPCRHTNGKDFKTALLLSIFFGWLGVDRFYLGYAAVGLFKLFTFGFFFLFHLVDIVMIALQIVGPADGSAYVIDYYGPRATYIRFTNETYVAASPQEVLPHEL